MNDLPVSLQFTKCILFADDTTIYHSSNNLQSLYNHVNLDLLSLSKWFRVNKLSLNASKTNYIHFGISKDFKCQHNLLVDNIVINQQDSVKFLGVHIDNNLDWRFHVKHCQSKLSSGLYILNRVKRLLPPKIMKSLYFNMIQSYLQYGTVVWGSTKQKYLRRLQIQQNKAIRIITLSEYNASTTPLYKSLNIPKLVDLHTLSMGRLMFRHSTNDLPYPLMMMFKCISGVHSHNTRHRNDVQIERRNMKITRDSFLGQAPMLWLSMNIDTKLCKSLGCFTRNFKRKLISQY